LRLGVLRDETLRTLFSMGALMLERPAEGAWLLRLHRPERRNALDAGLVRELRAALAAADSDPDCRVLLVAASGLVFCAGADLEEMASGGLAARELASFLLELHQHSRPSIALVHAAALGGGVGLVAACDLAIGTANARFRLPEVRIGLLPAVISPYLVRAMGARNAARHALDGEWFGPEAALSEGLLHELVGNDELLPRALALADSIARGAPGALAACKRTFGEVASDPVGESQAARLAQLFFATAAGPEARARIERLPQAGGGPAPAPAKGPG
jgi:methylglutaconyl-CoA hydratase